MFSFDSEMPIAVLFISWKPGKVERLEVSILPLLLIIFLCLGPLSSLPSFATGVYHLPLELAVKVRPYLSTTLASGEKLVTQS